MKRSPFLYIRKQLSQAANKCLHFLNTNALKRTISISILLISVDLANAQIPNISYPGGNNTRVLTVGTAITSLTPTNSGNPVIATGLTSTLAGSLSAVQVPPGNAGSNNATGVMASFNTPYGTTIDASGNIYVADAGNNLIRKITPAGATTTLAGSGAVGSANGTGTAASFYHPTGVCVDGSGNVYVADDYNNMIRKITSAGVVTTVAGTTTAGSANGTGTGATFHNPTGVCVDGSGNLYVADYTNNEIRKIVLSSGVVTTFAGSTTAGSANGTGTTATFNTPFGIAIDGSGNFYVADKGNNMIRKISSAAVVTTLAGTTTAGYSDSNGTSALFNAPTAVGVNGSGNIFVADANNNVIRMVTPAGVVTTYAGKGSSLADGGITVSKFSLPSGICVDGSGNVYVGDYSDNLIRKIVPIYYSVSPALPQGLSINGTTGVISGTPTLTTTSTDYTVTVYGTTNVDTYTLNIATGLLNNYDQGNQSFVQQENIKVAGITTDSLIYPLSDMQKQTTRTYYDGLGRPIQNVGIQASPLQNDLIQPVAYDNLGRQSKGYLPYAGQSTDVMGSYRPNALTTDQKAFYNNTSQYLIAIDTAAYNQMVFENTPLQRMISAGTVGTGFQPVSGQHYKTVSYRYNTSADGSILIWNPDGSFTASNYYGVSSLSVIDGKDEDNTETLAFTDKVGRTVLKRQILSSGNLDTYYIYNNAGMLIYTVPPKATGLLSANSYNIKASPLSNLVFHFVYDTMGRLTQKTVPAKSAMYIVYDPMNRPVLMQDSNMRVNNTWNYIKYDGKGRVINQGTYTDATHTTLSAMQTYVNGLASSYNTTWYESRTTATSFNYYTNTVFPATSLTPMAFTYFDDYDVNNNGTADFAYSNQGLTGEIGATTAPVKGMPTISIQVTIGSGVSSMWLTKVIFYDKRGNPIQARTSNQVYNVGSFGLSDISTVVPDFVGVPQIIKVSKMSSATVTTTVQSNFTYDHMYRVKSVSQTYNGGTSSVVASYTYNELGQVIQKGLGQVSGSTYLQNVDMRYNIRGQLLSINNSQLSSDGGVTNNDTNDVFGMVMLYDQVDSHLANTACYNGKLSAVKWMSKNSTGGRSWERAYKYSYDGVDRYTAAVYTERDTLNTGGFGNNPDGFDEVLTYDNGGNITSLGRNSSTQGTNSYVQIDNLAYTYDPNNPNQLKTVTDGTDANHTGAGFRNLTGSTGNYTYDGNGNLSADPYKGLTLAYDVLNRTDKITVTTSTNRWVDYTYNASGQLIRKRQYDNNVLQNTTDYVDGFVYINGTLSYFPMPEGRVLNISGTLKQEFIITDQQGNARVSFQANASGHAVVMQENSYYPTGLIMPNSPVATPTTPNKQLYNGGSEWQNDYSNLPDYYQTFNRNYDAVIGRFIGVDPVAESAETLTSYQYAGNNPVMYNDPLGDLLPMPGSHNVNFGYWAPLNLGGSGNANAFDQAWSQDGGNEMIQDYSGFWGSFTGDANLYLNTNGQDVNVHLAGSTISTLYNNYQQNGDEGAITNAIITNDSVLQPMFGGSGTANGTASVNANTSIGGFFHTSGGAATTINGNSAAFFEVNSADASDVNYARQSLNSLLNSANQDSEQDSNQKAPESPSLWDKATAIYGAASYGAQQGIKIVGTGLTYGRILENLDGGVYVASLIKDSYNLATGNMSLVKWEMNQAIGGIGFIVPEVSITYFGFDAFAPKVTSRIEEFIQVSQDYNEKNHFDAH